MTLSRIGHRREMKKGREKLPSLAQFFRTPDGKPIIGLRSRHSTQYLLSSREVPVSGLAFTYWLMATWQRQFGKRVERGFPFRATGELPVDLDPHGLSLVALPGLRTQYRRTLDSYRRIYEEAGVSGLKRRAQSRRDAAEDEVSAYLAIHFGDRLIRRYDYIRGLTRPILEDCAAFAWYSALSEEGLAHEEAARADLLERIKQDITRLAGEYVPLTQDVHELSVHQPIPYAAALGQPEAAVDAVMDGHMLEVKTARHLAVEGACDQLFAYYLLDQLERGDRSIETLSFYLARHECYVSASVAEIRKSYPVDAFFKLLLDAERAHVDRVLNQSFLDFCEHQRATSGVRAWEKEDEIVSIGRRYERAGRIGVTEIAAVRAVPDVLNVSFEQTNDQALAGRIRQIAEANRLEAQWEALYEMRREAYLRQSVSLASLEKKAGERGV
ncbi:hypothetical protein [Ferroacidibacillus organovorans]|uniref:Uncharacterized protein n=1 Tax=Ferroacidibacillus organovorans TaxID=1765683 RepID=A0A124IW67_9BACL|nr:hypothetical protein [Ferroacidibacillus organovorans]KUO96424.1 hypothetical protein ATW55_00835 [Ferroacidibacillus organovorans]